MPAAPAPASAHTLPAELWLAVFDPLALPDLAALSRACARFHALADRVLYRAIHSSWSSDGRAGTPRSLAPARLVACLASLDRGGGAAPLVRALHIEWSAGVEPTANFYRLLHRVLRRATALTALGLSLPYALHGSDGRGAAAGALQAWLLAGCAFSLTELVVAQPYDAALAAFLATQPRIADLSLTFSGEHDDGAGGTALPADALPALGALRSVNLPPRALRELIAGRPVECAALSLAPAHGPTPLDALRLSARPLRRLTIMSVTRAPLNTEILAAVAARFPELEALHAFVVWPGYTTEALLASTPIIRSFSQLKYLTFMVPDLSALLTSSSTLAAHTDVTEMALDAEERVAAAWAAACPTLRTIILPQGRVWFTRAELRSR